ncbi:efflux RND transporter periplasmic adaptor subunit [Acuticoccus sp. MNP-M23]|uniref:efflux RND transporter periplasmic adaptor subunit n=1 Tax=Acuticoccus sp. MNP-M23 TaxID=3072793 RepID=UPI002815CB21|nr:efflux RND transporter periplasmic adaptor subunit [Acuticoccus sp. MNP-M23]WMS43888.1 efflux RND transporter periplasmic adaptor subunit [Acuticoccus sp. MNP-M23]
MSITVREPGCRAAPVADASSRMAAHAPNALGLIPPRPPARPRRRSAALAAIVAIALTAGGLAMRFALPHSVEQVPVLPQTFSAEVLAPATLEAERRANIAMERTGRIAALGAAEGDVVAKGDVIARLEAEDLAAELEAAEATEQAAQLGVTMAEAEKARADATLSRVTGEEARKRTLVTRGVVSTAGHEVARAALDEAAADQTRAEAALARARSDADAAAARTRVRRAQLSDTVIRAPIGGVLVEQPANVGDTLSQGAPIATIVDPKTLVFTAMLDESAVQHVDVGQTARIAPAGSGAPIAARVVRIGRTVEEGTREFAVDLAPERVPARWAMGERARATVSTGTRSGVLAAPSGALAPRDGVQGVWIANQGRLSWRPVTLGDVTAGAVEIREGIAPGEVVALTDRAFERMRVVPADGPVAGRDG